MTLSSALFFILLLLLGKRSGRRPLTDRSPRSPALPAPFIDAWKTRTLALVKRAASGDLWVPKMAALLGSQLAGAAAGRWIGIESGGDPRAQSRLGERGLAQVMRGTLAELGMGDSEWNAMISPRTTDDEHAAIAARVMRGEVKLADNVANRHSANIVHWGPLRLGAGKLRHGLPLLLRELAEQGILRPFIGETITAARVAPFRPSARLASFAGKQHAVTGNVVDDLMIRFLGSAAVVAQGESAVTMFDLRATPPPLPPTG